LQAGKFNGFEDFVIMLQDDFHVPSYVLS